MKNKIYYLGIATTIIVTVGCLFKIMHWPGANVMICIGLLVISLFFIPLAFRSSFASEKNKKQIWFYVLAAVILSINFISALFKIMHWPGAGLLLIISLPLPFVVLLPAFLFTYRVEKEINYNNFLAIMFFFAYFAAISALLALSVQKEVLTSFVKSAIGFEQKSEVLKQQCLSLHSEIVNDSTKLKQVRPIASKIEEQARLLCEKIDYLKKILIIRGSGNPREVLKDSNYTALWKIDHMENKVLVENYYLDELKNELIKYKNLIYSDPKFQNDLKAYIDKVMNTEDNYDGPWSNIFQKDKILISVIDKLDMLQYQVRFVQYQTLLANE